MYPRLRPLLLLVHLTNQPVDLVQFSTFVLFKDTSESDGDLLGRAAILMLV
jgi:hypothetical protein